MGPSPGGTSSTRMPTGTEDEQAADERDLPEGSFRSEVIKNRLDPEVRNRTLEDPEED